jgi:hypothetical protein
MSKTQVVEAARYSVVPISFVGKKHGNVRPFCKPREAEIDRVLTHRLRDGVRGFNAFYVPGRSIRQKRDDMLARRAHDEFERILTYVVNREGYTIDVREGSYPCRYIVRPVTTVPACTRTPLPTV